MPAAVLSLRDLVFTLRIMVRITALPVHAADLLIRAMIQEDAARDNGLGVVIPVKLTGVCPKLSRFFIIFPNPSFSKRGI